MALDGVSDKLFSRRAMKAELLDVCLVPVQGFVLLATKILLVPVLRGGWLSGLTSGNG